MTGERALISVPGRRREKRVKLSDPHSLESIDRPLGNNRLIYCEDCDSFLIDGCTAHLPPLASPSDSFEETSLDDSSSSRPHSSLENIRDHPQDSLDFKYPCKQCNESFSRKSTLKEHIKTAHDLRAQMGIPCPDCSKAFSSQESMNKHLRSTHLKVRDHPCELCDKAFLLKGHLEDHIKAVHLKIRDQHCPHCSRSFSAKGDLNKHIRGIHSKPKQPAPIIPGHHHVCSHCNKGFKQKGHLEEHINAVHLKIRNHHCTLCDKSFSAKGDLNRHLRIHSKATHHPVETMDGLNNSEEDFPSSFFIKTEPIDTDHPCPHCNKSFNAKSGLYKHILSTHSNVSPLDNLEVIDCNAFPEETQSTSPSYSSQITTSLNDPSAGPMESPSEHICDYCCQAFVQKVNLEDHIKEIHLKTLDHDSRSFSDQGDLNNLNLQGDHLGSIEQNPLEDVISSPDHILSPEWLKPHSSKSTTSCNYECDRCSRAFIQKEHLNDHIKAVHLKSPYPDSKSFTDQEDFSKQLHGPHLDITDAQSIDQNPLEDVASISDPIQSPEGLELCSLKSTKTRVRNYECDECKRAFTQKGHLEDHIKAIHLKIRDHHCPHCDKSFSAKGDLNRHVRTHSKSMEEQDSEYVETASKSRAHRCDYCRKAFTQRGHLDDHVKAIHLKIKDQYCHLCSRSFSAKRDLNRHLRTHSTVSPMGNDTSSVNREMFEDIPSPKLISAMNDPMNKQMEFHRTRDHICDYCCQAFLRKAHLEDHIKAVHFKIRDHHCLHCSKSFSAKGDLNKHLRRAHSNYSLNAVDSIEQDPLGDSVEIHYRREDVSSPECDQSFIFKDLLHNNHMQLAHLSDRQSSNLQPHRCTICSRAFLRKSSLEKHMKVVHRETRVFPCPECDVTFNHKEPLDRHLRSIHYKLRNHFCTFCSSTFTQKWHLEDHIKAVHFKIRDHHCSHCELSFSAKGTLNKHIKAIHSKALPSQ